MKDPQKIITMAIVCLLVTSATTLKAATAPANIPGNVLNQFSSQYPDATIKKWKVEKGNYIAEFKDNGMPAKSTYNGQGAWEKTEVEIKHIKQLPATVSAGFNKSEFHNYYVESIEQVSTPTGIRYIVDVDNCNGNKGITEGYGGLDNEELKFNGNGLLIGITDLNGPDEDDI